MKKQDVEKRVTNVRQAGQVWRNVIKTGRDYYYRPADIKAILEKLELSQSEFAFMIGASVATLRNREQGRLGRCSGSRRRIHRPWSKRLTSDVGAATGYAIDFMMVFSAGAGPRPCADEDTP